VTETLNHCCDTLRLHRHGPRCVTTIRTLTPPLASHPSRHAPSLSRSLIQQLALCSSCLARTSHTTVRPASSSHRAHFDSRCAFLLDHRNHSGVLPFSARHGDLLAISPSIIGIPPQPCRSSAKPCESLNAVTTIELCAASTIAADGATRNDTTDLQSGIWHAASVCSDGHRSSFGIPCDLLDTGSLHWQQPAIDVAASVTSQN
jgi:hypothetical protein